MDDDIEIEEHDILQHPEVRAAFPDLCDIQIQVHTAGDEFLEDTSAYTEETESLLHEIPFTEDAFDEESQRVVENEGLKEPFNETDYVHKLFEDAYEECEKNVQDKEIDDIQELSDVEIEAPENETAKSIDNDQENSDVEFVDELHAIPQSKDDEIGSSDVELVNEYQPETILPDQTFTAELINKIDREQFILEDKVTEVFYTEDKFTDNVQNTNDEFIENDQDLNEEYVGNSQDADDDVEVRHANNERIDSLGSMEDIVDDHSEVTKEDSHYNENQAISDTKQWVLDQNSEYLDKELPEFEYEVPIKEEVDDYLDATPEESYNDDELPPEDIFHFNNKIILGSKPSHKNLESRKKSSFLVVLLDDWSVHLNQSNSYCRACKILFTTPNALDVHKMVSHSFLTPLTNRAVKSTAKSSINVARKRTTDNLAQNSSIPQSTYCNHCNVTFEDRNALIKHLYELLPAKQFACNFCDEKFENQSDLVTHNSVHMKVEKKVLKAKKNENNPLLKSLLEMRKKVPAVKVKAEPVDTSSDTQTLYKCQLCGEIFDLYFKARAHRLLHPETKNKVLFKTLRCKKLANSKDKFKYEDDSSKKIKITPKNFKHVDDGSKKTKITPKTEPKNVKILFEEDIKAINDFELIPKSTLFKCPKCSLHFVSCYAGIRHCVREHCDTTKVVSCPTCRRKLRAQDIEEHKKQHIVCSKFRVYAVTKDICARTLCKCLKCKVHFRFLTLKPHIGACGKISTGKCKQCNIIVPSNSLLTHAHIHRTLKMKPKDFIIVDYAVMNKRKQTTKKETSDKDIKKENAYVDKKVNPIAVTIKSEPGTSGGFKDRLQFEKDKLKLYFCGNCKCYVRRNVPKSIRMHSTKKCISKGRGTICAECGLRLPSKLYNSHMKLHAKTRLTLEDFEFYDFKTLRRIVPAVPKYPNCRTCKIHFLDMKMLCDHICGEDYENCDICEEKFEVSTLKAHRPFHILQETSKPKPEQTKILPELIKKYESLNAIWNVLFVCDKCELVTDLYNKAVEHSQSHLNRELIQTNTIKCYICNLKFEESCWAKHSEMHSRMKINNKNFKILKYVPRNLLDESWFRMFESLPEKEIRQIIDRSVFGSERSLKMRLIKDGLPEFTVYCCSECQVSYDNNSILGHVKAPCEHATLACKACNIAFAHPNTLQFHEMLHKKGIKKEEFRIVCFVKNSNDIKDYSRSDVQIKNGTACKADSKETKCPKFILYRCQACTACIIRKNNMSRHNCVSKHKLRNCKICKQNFYFRRMMQHLKQHKDHPKLTARNIKIVTFGRTDEDEHISLSVANTSRKILPLDLDTTPKAKPSQSLNKTTKLTRSTNPKQDTQLNKSATCGELENSNSMHNLESLVNMMTKDNPKPNKRTTLNSSKHKTDLDLNVGTAHKTAKLYKCDCGLHYTSLRAIEAHIQTCEVADEISKENCSKCGLLFPTDILVSHLCKHHSRDTRLQVEFVHKKAKKTDLDATSTQEKTSSPSMAKNYDKLYKCADCNVYFLNQNSCYKHTSKHEPLDPKMYIECKMCSLQFRILSLHVHIKKHHDKDFDLHKVLVEEYRPSVGKQAPKIDIYFASERLQNVQVSSSND